MTNAIIDTQETFCAGCGEDITGTAAGQVRGYCCLECEVKNREATRTERLAAAARLIWLAADARDLDQLTHAYDAFVATVLPDERRPGSRR